MRGTADQQRKQQQRKTPAPRIVPGTTRCRFYKPLAVRAHNNDDLVDVRSGAAAAAAGGAGGSSSSSPSPGPVRQSAQQGKGFSPVLVLAGAFTAILCGVALIWMSSTGALDATTAGAAPPGVPAAVTEAGGKAAAALGALLHHLWVVLAEVGHLCLCQAVSSSCCFAVCESAVILTMLVSCEHAHRSLMRCCQAGSTAGLPSAHTPAWQHWHQGPCTPGWQQQWQLSLGTWC